VEGEETITARLSYFGRLGYNFDNKYIRQASLRADAADLAYLSKDNRWGYFPAVSAGWNISREDFMESTRTWLSDLKFRASWGQNGSLAALGAYTYSTDMGSAGSYAFGDGLIYTIGARPSSMGNPELKWETSEQFDIGFDTRFFNNRLTFNFDYYKKTTKDLLVRGTTPSLTIGGTTSVINAGDVENKGFEFELGWRDRISDFSYGINTNLSTLKNKVTYLDKSLTRIAGTNYHTSTITFFEEGYPVYYFRGYQLQGINSATGEPIFKDITGEGIINDEDKTDIGNAIPKMLYGVTLTAAWKGIDLIVFGTGTQGNKIFNCLSRTDYPQRNVLKEVFYDDRWTTDNTTGSRPRSGATGIDNYVISDALVYDGSFFKIKQIQLGYTLPKELTKKALINNARLYVSLDDFFTLTKYPGFDPEASAGSNISAMGVDKGSYPTSKKVVFGINLEF
jgi:TonB-linked SusC/RagA family outer membrane protein